MYVFYLCAAKTVRMNIRRLNNTVFDNLNDTPHLQWMRKASIPSDVTFTKGQRPYPGVSSGPNSPG